MTQNNKRKKGDDEPYITPRHQHSLPQKPEDFSAHLKEVSEKIKKIKATMEVKKSQPA